MMPAKKLIVPVIVLSVFVLFLQPVHADGGEAQAVQPQEASLSSETKTPAAGLQPAAAQDTGPADYRIGAGDLLDISVWKDEALTRTAVTVRPDGRISFPLAGEMVADGRTVAQLKAELEERLLPYVSDLVLSVEVKQINSMMVYVIGRVNAPGRFILNSNITVLQALAIAGGCNPFASPNSIKVLRKEGNVTYTYPFRYYDVVEDDKLEDNIELKRGDVIVVP
jgi:polysaccharide biosynthesis/export protein